MLRFAQHAPRAPLETRATRTLNQPRHPSQHTRRWPGADELIVPEGETYGGVCDRHLIFRYVSRRRVLNTLPWMVSNGSRGGSQHRIRNIEHAQLLYFGREGLRVQNMRRSMFTAARQSGEDSRWNRRSTLFNCAANLTVKYPTEYIVAMANCLANFGGSARPAFVSPDADTAPTPMSSCPLNLSAQVPLPGQNAASWRCVSPLSCASEKPFDLDYSPNNAHHRARPDVTNVQ